MKIFSGPILTLAGGSLVLAMCACSRTDSPGGSLPPDNNYTTNAPSGSGGGGGSHAWLWNHGYRAGTGSGYIAPDGRSVTQEQALAESGYSRAGGSSGSTASGPPQGTTSRGGFGSTGESSGSHASGGHGGGGE